MEFRDRIKGWADGLVPHAIWAFLVAAVPTVSALIGQAPWYYVLTVAIASFAAMLFLIEKFWAWFRKHGKTRGGLNFFQNRSELNKTFGSLPDRLTGFDRIDAILVVGTKFYQQNNKRLNAIGRLILPRPDSESLKFYEKSLRLNNPSLLIREVTKIAIDNGVKVKWSRSFIFHSVILADIEKPTGWAHVESVLPFTVPDQRQSYTLQKSHFSEAIHDINTMFEKLWLDSDDPD